MDSRNFDNGAWGSEKLSKVSKTCEMSYVDRGLTCGQQNLGVKRA